jgi:hypothetical protein
MKKILGITVVCFAMLSFAPVYATVNLALIKKNNPELNKATKSA